MKYPPSKLGHLTAFMHYAALLVLAAAVGTLHADIPSTNDPPKQTIYQLAPITAVKKGEKDLPYMLTTSIPVLRVKENSDPTDDPIDTGIGWSADKGTPVFTPNTGAIVELDFEKPFIKEDTDEAKKVTVTATYTHPETTPPSATNNPYAPNNPSAPPPSSPPTVENEPPRTETDTVKLTYLDFLIAKTVESTDDVLIVRDENYVLAATDKKVIHWAKVVVKHSATDKLPLELNSSGEEKKLYFYGEEGDPNQLPADPPLKDKLSKEYKTDEWFWIGTDEKGPGEGKFKAKGNLGTGLKEAPEEKTVRLVPVDLDIIHPVTGELSDAKEDVDDGGYVSVQRLEDPADATSDVTPKTKVKIHAISGAQSTWKTRLKFNGADRYKIYRDEARKQEVVSEQTFDATQDTTLFFHGLKKSASRGGEQVTMQVKVSDTWVDGDSVKCTIVQSEFLIQVKAFIPYAWTEAEEIPGYIPQDPPLPPIPADTLSPMYGRVAKGDLHPGYGDRPASPSFINKYSTDFSRGSTPSYKDFQNAPFRVCQAVIITPYKELHATSDIHGERNLYTAPLSETFEKATSVNAAEMHLKMGFMGLSGAAIKTGKPPELHENYDHENRTANRVAEVTIEGGGKDGAIPALGGVIPTAWAAADIHWRLYLKIWCDLDPLKPKVEFGGSHDSYPAYEIIVIQSDGNFKDIHRVSPAAGAMPGPNSLGDGKAINVGRTDTITE